MNPTRPFLALGIGSMLILAGTASGQIILMQDGFETVTHPGGDRTIPAGTGTAFYTRYSSTVTSAVIQSDATFGSNGLLVSDSLSGDGLNAPLVASFPAVSLSSVGDYVELTIVFRFTNSASATDSTSAFRLGLFSSLNTAVTADDSANSTDDTGYYVQIGEGTPTEATNLFFRETGGTNPILAGTDRSNAVSSQAGFGLGDNLVHTAVFRVTLTSATQVGLSLTMDALGTRTATASANPMVLDELAISNGFATPALSFAVDSVTVTTNVPEPGSAAMILAGAAALSLARRRPGRAR